MSALKKQDRVFVEDVIQVVTQEIPSPYIILNISHWHSQVVMGGIQEKPPVRVRGIEYKLVR